MPLGGCPQHRPLWSVRALPVSPPPITSRGKGLRLWFWSKIRWDLGKFDNKLHPVLLCTNGYAPRFARWLRARVLPVYSAQIAVTISDKVRLPRQMPTVSASAPSYEYFRRVGARNFLFGGRLEREHVARGDLSGLLRQLKERMPALTGARLSHQWTGRIAISSDFMPHLARLKNGVWVAGGYTGHARRCALDRDGMAVGAGGAIRRNGPAHSAPQFPAVAPLSAKRGTYCTVAGTRAQAAKQEPAQFTPRVTVPDSLHSAPGGLLWEVARTMRDVWLRCTIEHDSHESPGTASDRTS